MNVSVALLPDEIDPQLDLTRCCVAVIDVLRATSVMSTAGKAGALDIVTYASSEEARRMAKQSEVPSLLCGERHCIKIEGFDLGNSPSEYTTEQVTGKRVIMTTTNGTAAIAKSQTAGEMICVSLLNFSASVKELSGHESVCIVCAGTNGRISSEDVLLAGGLVDALKVRDQETGLDDSARIAWALWQQSVGTGKPDASRIVEELRRSQGGRNLQAIGHGDDIAVCSQIDSVEGIIRRVSSNPPTFRYQAADAKR
ncbi:2-phosphosulfolactate phosphatase [Stieleria varia]|uniref:Probable 2-phosphosulfolactate phosphatase n=1 Tax=Stieleria varia TaxID=2528005 RepID=A0A5C6A3H8_9BACT|nr:2-phosphosulfolactate phosphatase [Stieleria varia]TWT94462.1 putative 2-phosphosulfolactate phosphatase [Stieleria varia]